MSPSSSCPGTLPKTKSSKIPAIPHSSLKVPRLITARQTKRHNQWPRKTLRAPRRARLTMPTPRSEERRVGKESETRWAPNQEHQEKGRRHNNRVNTDRQRRVQRN